ncbi:hypothetical protein V8C35DRAFT_307630 [Trichoderma chlorosporum]
MEQPSSLQLCQYRAQQVPSTPNQCARHFRLGATEHRMFGVVECFLWSLSQCLCFNASPCRVLRQALVQRVVLAVTLHCSSCLFFFLRVYRETSSSITGSVTQSGAQGSEPRAGQCQAPAAMPKYLDLQGEKRSSALWERDRRQQAFHKQMCARLLWTWVWTGPTSTVAFEEAMIADDDICFSRKFAGVATEQAHWRHRGRRC